MKKLLVIFALFFVGCIQINPVIQVTKPYEGHFYNSTDIKAAVEKISLQKDESVWILSNETLKRVLKNN